ncbi:Sec-independent protein translocase subunit TatA [Pseudonocardia phyllosphaerae]|uniref:Sec-independent protein translocase subunit TatA n=1 Tax=Pseudonocardia phyllosphaerae TaxID=3390502 RepID=UPI00397E5962
MPGGYEWLIIIAVLLLLFGAKKLPDMARSVGQSARVFKGEMKGLKEDGAQAKDQPAAPAQEIRAAEPEQPAQPTRPAQPAQQDQAQAAPQHDGTTGTAGTTR